MFCERCGLNFLPRQSLCTRCKVSATRHWFQLMSLATLSVAIDLQRARRAALLASLGRGRARGSCFSCVVVVRLQMRTVRLGADGHCPLGLGFPGVERSATKGERLVYAQAVDVFSSGGRRTHAPVVGSRRTASGAVPGNDWKISRGACCFGVDRGARRGGAAVQRRRIA